MLSGELRVCMNGIGQTIELSSRSVFLQRLRVDSCPRANIVDRDQTYNLRLNIQTHVARDARFVPVLSPHLEPLDDQIVRIISTFLNFLWANCLNWP